MHEILKADIFFFISSIFVAILTIILIIFGFYLLKIMKNFSSISEKLKDSVDITTEELGKMSEHVRESAIFTFIFGKYKKSKKNIKA